MPNELAYYTMDDLRLGQGGFLRKAGRSGSVRRLEEALAHYRGIPSPSGRCWA